MAGIWDEVKSLIKQGSTGFTVNLTPGHVVESKRSRGRPRTRDVVSPFGHYADPRVRLTGGKNKPRCVRKNCGKKLKKNDLLVCSDECAELVKMEALNTLRMIGLREERPAETKTVRKRPRGLKAREVA